MPAPTERRLTMGRRGTVQESFLTETQEAVLKFLQDGTNQEVRSDALHCASTRVSLAAQSTPGTTPQLAAYWLVVGIGEACSNQQGGRERPWQLVRRPQRQCSVC